MILESDSSSIIKDSAPSTITHVAIKGGSRSGSKSSHLILQDLQCDYRFDLFFRFSFSFSHYFFVLVSFVLVSVFLVLVLVFVNELLFSFHTSFVIVLFNENHTSQQR